MSIRHCIESAVTQGAIGREMADELVDTFEAFKRHYLTAYGPAEAIRRAQEDLAKRLESEALQRRRAALIQAEAAERLKGDLFGHRNTRGQIDPAAGLIALLEHMGESWRGPSSGSIEQVRRGILGTTHAKLEGLLHEFRTTALSGQRMNRMRLDNVAREVHGEQTGDVAARAFADSWAQVAEELRLRYNEHGGMIGKLQGGWLPQMHDARALLAAGRDTWKSQILPRLDRDKIVSELTGKPLIDAEMDAALDHIYDGATTRNWAHEAPTMAQRGKGALVRQHAEHRFLHFKNADAWLEYQRDFGQGDTFASMMQHVSMMVRDIAAMQVLGPNPVASFEFLKQTVEREAYLKKAGKAAAFPDVAHPVDYARSKIHRAEQIFAHLRGSASAPVSTTMAQTVAATRNVTTSIVMGAASLSSVSDFGTQKLARLFVVDGEATGGLHGRAAFGFDTVYDVLKQASMDNRRVAVRSGLMLDSAAHAMGEQARYIGTLNGPEWSQWMSSRVLTLTGLTPITQMQKHAFGLWAMGEAADHIAMPFDRNPMRKFFERYGIDQLDYQVMQIARVHDLSDDGLGAMILRPSDIADMNVGLLRQQLHRELAADIRGGLGDQMKAGRVLTAEELAIFLGQAEPEVPPVRAGRPSIPSDPPDLKVRRYLRNLSEKYLGAILQETYYAVPDANATSRSLLLGDVQPGTAQGELLRLGSQLKSYPVFVAISQIGRITGELQQGNRIGGAAYAGGLLIGMTLLGALAIQLKQISKGEDARDMADPAFWGAATLQGGGGGIWGDFLSASVNRHGGGPLSTFSGPVIGKTGDLLSLTVGNAGKVVTGKPTHFNREATQFATSNVPFVSSAWYTKLVWQRMVADQIQKVSDPDAYAAWHRAKQTAQRERGAGFYWERGATGPRRAPDFSTAWQPGRVK